MKQTPLLVVTGPTASGKSALALQLCEILGGEIVSCDSMQIYRGCDIATAKPTPEERSRVPHHLLDICRPDERFSAAQWALETRKVVRDIENRGKLAIICGGTGFYLRALLQPDVLSEVAPDAALREQLNAQVSALGAIAMHEKLAELDARAAHRLHPNDSFRVLRALEVALGEKEKSAIRVAAPSEFSPPIFGFDWPRDELYQRINQRVDAMLQAGLMDELQFLVAKWGRDAPALGGVGYKQMMPVLNKEIEFSAGLEAWKRDTRRYAKRQMTWFRHQLKVHWLDPKQPPNGLARHVEKQFSTIVE